MLGYLLMRADNNSFLSFPAAQDFRILHGNTSRIAVKTDGNVGIGNTNPQGTLDLGDATAGKSIVWGGSSGTSHYTSIWSEYSTGSLVLAGGLKSSTTAADFIYPYTGSYGYAAIELDSFQDDGIKFYTAADAARTAGAVATKQERMRIDTSGNVGIGTTVPDRLLTIRPSSGNSQVGIRVSDTTSLSQLIFADSADSNVGEVRYDHSNDSLQFHVANVGEKMRLDSVGDLTIKGGRVYVRESDDGNVAVAITRDADEGYLQLFSSGTQTVEFRGNGNSYFNGGNVGIGIASPAATLHVKEIDTDEDAIIKISPNNGSYDPVLQFTPQDGTLDNEGFEIWYDNNVGDAHIHTIYNNDAAAIRFHTRTGASKSTSNERLTIAGDGNVGIGTTSPSEKLSIVSGDISLTTGYGIHAVNGGNENGMFFHAAAAGNSGNLLNFKTDGSERMRIDSTGNVGIGVTSPALQSGGTGLHINDTTNSELKFTNNTTGATASDGTALVASGSTFTLNNREAGSIKLGTSNTTRVTIDSTGNVGIGTTNPGYKLDVAGDAAANFVGKVSTGASGATNDPFRLEYDTNSWMMGVAPNASAGNLTWGLFWAGNSGAAYGTNGAGGPGNIWSNSSNPNEFAFVGSANTKWSLWGDDGSTWQAGDALIAGNVGIGTTSPVTTLNIANNNESTTQTDFTQAVTKAGILITTEYTIDAYTPGLFWNTSNQNATLPKAGIYLKESNTGTCLYFGTSNNYSTGITNDAMVINPNGNVGIGTTSPNALIHISGASNGTQTYGRFSTGSLNGDQNLYIQSGSNRDHMAIQVKTGAGANDDLSLNPEGGNVGIGTTSPNNNLVVSDTVQPSYTPAVAGEYIEIARTSGGDAGFLINKNTGQWLFGIDNSDGTNPPLRFEYSAAGSAHAGFGNATLGLALKSDGNVGIGYSKSSSYIRYCI
jgi:hypothetical protein